MSAKKKKISKDLYGVMFEIRTNPDGSKEAVPTQDTKKAAYVVAPGKKKRCPYCSSDKCLTNISGESSRLSRDYFQDSKEGFIIGFLDIATCRLRGEDFIIGRNKLFTPRDKGKCIWCGSPHTEKITNLSEVRKSFFQPDRLKKYRLLIRSRRKDNGFAYSHIKGMAIDELHIFLFNDPWRCNHCKRVFGYELNQDDLFGDLADELLRKDLEEFVEDSGVKEQMLDVDEKCPLCSCKLIFNNWFTEILPQLQQTNNSEAEGRYPFEIRKYKCAKCNNDFPFIVYNGYADEIIKKK